MTGDRLEIDAEGVVWWISGDEDVTARSLGDVESAGDRVPAGLEREWDRLMDEWCDRFDARAEAEASWWRGATP